MTALWTWFASSTVGRWIITGVTFIAMLAVAWFVGRREGSTSANTARDQEDAKRDRENKETRDEVDTDVRAADDKSLDERLSRWTKR
jgi:type VI protein secretion system component VasK